MHQNRQLSQRIVDYDRHVLPGDKCSSDDVSSSKNSESCPVANKMSVLPMSRVATTSAETVKALILANTLLGLNGRLWPVSSSPLSFSASVGEPDGTRLLLNDEDLVERDPGAPGAGAASSMIRSMGHNNARLRGR